MSLFFKKDENTYRHDVTCDNCGEYETIDIPKGVEVKGHIKDLPCPNCDCKKLKQSSGGYY